MATRRAMEPLAAPNRSPRRVLDVLGLGCLIATLALLSGVRAVRAESPEPAAVSVDPVLVEYQAEKTVPAAPKPPKVEGEDRRKPGIPAIEVSPGVVVLNTRGYNYGPPIGEIDPAALSVEQRTAPQRP